MTRTKGTYSTPFGSFDTWEDAANVCERMDMDPCELVTYVGPQAVPPSLVSYEIAPGGITRLSFQVKCF
jgi:hypothetical protein